MCTCEDVGPGLCMCAHVCEDPAGPGEGCVCVCIRKHGIQVRLSGSRCEGTGAASVL